MQAACSVDVIPITHEASTVVTFGLIFWGNSSLAESLLRIQKKAIRLMMGYGYRETCRDLFKELHICH
jgi:hypothetical protein